MSRPIRSKVSDLARQPGSARSTVATLEMLTLVSSADMIKQIKSLVSPAPLASHASGADTALERLQTLIRF